MEFLGHQARVSPALEYLRERTLHGVKLGLDAPRRLLRELGDPQDQYPTLLVAGTIFVAYSRSNDRPTSPVR